MAGFAIGCLGKVAPTSNEVLFAKVRRDAGRMTAVRVQYHRLASGEGHRPRAGYVPAEHDQADQSDRRKYETEALRPGVRFHVDFLVANSTRSIGMRRSRTPVAA